MNEEPTALTRIRDSISNVKAEKGKDNKNNNNSKLS